jgi:hypothetical protein
LKLDGTISPRQTTTFGARATLMNKAAVEFSVLAGLPVRGSRAMAGNVGVLKHASNSGPF